MGRLSDTDPRILDVRRIADVQYRGLDGVEKSILQPMPTASTPRPGAKPLPPEYHALFIRFERWQAQDAVVQGAGPAGISRPSAVRRYTSRRCPRSVAPTSVQPWRGTMRRSRDALGSNELVAGADDDRACDARERSALGRSIPGIWHHVSLSSPQLQVAGATLAGGPGVILRHNELC